MLLRKESNTSFESQTQISIVTFKLLLKEMTGVMEQLRVFEKLFESGARPILTRPYLTVTGILFGMSLSLKTIVRELV